MGLIWFKYRIVKANVDWNLGKKSVFSVITIIPISSEIIEEAIKLRKYYNLSVGDSIISATTKIFKLTLYTNNEDDFKSLKELKIFNPLTKD